MCVCVLCVCELVSVYCIIRMSVSGCFIFHHFFADVFITFVTVILHFYYGVNHVFSVKYMGQGVCVCMIVCVCLCIIEHVYVFLHVRASVSASVPTCHYHYYTTTIQSKLHTQSLTSLLSSLNHLLGFTVKISCNNRGRSDV